MAKKTKEISSKNQIISLLEHADYIKNPLVYSQLRGNMTLIQTNVYVAVAAAMQDRINNQLSQKGQMGQSLFTSQELHDKLFTFTIPLSSLQLNAKDYDKVEETCRKMVEKSFTYRWKDENGTLHTDINAIFTKISIPSETSESGYTRRVGDIKVEMKTEVAERLFSLRTGYVTHLREIVPKCHNAKTPRLYIYLCSLNDRDFHKGVGEINYIDLKEYLGLATYNKTRDAVVEDKYTMYSFFKRDVLVPIQTELNKLVKNGDVEFSFNYEPIYANGKKRGNPDKIRFILVPPIVEAEEIEYKTTDEPIYTLTEEQQQKWTNFCALLEQQDKQFYDVFVTPCNLHTDGEELVSIYVPTSFVREKWIEKIDDIRTCFRSIFGNKHFTLDIDPNYH